MAHDPEGPEPDPAPDDTAPAAAEDTPALPDDAGGDPRTDAQRDAADVGGD